MTQPVCNKLRPSKAWVGREDSKSDYDTKPKQASKCRVEGRYQRENSSLGVRPSKCHHLLLLIAIHADVINLHRLSISLKCCIINTLQSTPSPSNSDVHCQMKFLVKRPYGLVC